MKITVIVPCHNSSEYVETCLKHIVSQTIGIENLEIILVDDASDDGGKTVDILMKYESMYPDNIMVIKLTENVRQGGARNVAIGYSTGEYIAFCDSDDWLCNDALEILYDVAKKYDADSVEFDLFNLFDAKEFPKYESIKTARPSECEYVEINSVQDRKNNIFRSDSSLGHPSKFYRGDLIRDNDVRFMEGCAFEEPAFTMMVRFLEKKYVRIHVPLYYVLVHNNSTMQSEYETKKYDNAATHLFLYGRLKEKGFLEEYSEEIEYLFWYWYYLNTILFAVHRGVFFTEDELCIMQNHVRAASPDIGSNRYFIKYWGALPQLASLTYCNIHEVGVDTLREVYTKVNELC